MRILAKNTPFCPLGGRKRFRAALATAVHGATGFGVGRCEVEGSGVPRRQTRLDPRDDAKYSRWERSGKAARFQPTK